MPESKRGVNCFRPGVNLLLPHQGVHVGRAQVGARHGERLRHLLRDGGADVVGHVGGVLASDGRVLALQKQVLSCDGGRGGGEGGERLPDSRLAVVPLLVSTFRPLNLSTTLRGMGWDELRGGCGSVTKQ